MMSVEIEGFTLDELGYLGRGKSKHRPRNDPRLYGGKYPFVQTGDVKAANLYVKEYSGTYNDFGLAQSKLWKKGTLAITIAANIAETAVLGQDSCFPDSVVGFEPDKEKVNAFFIKYYIDHIKREMQSISQGTTQDNLSLEKLRTFKFKVPCKQNVEKITEILLNYDNLIENNNRRIAILEEMAQSLYREWFVKFRFPGHDQAADKPVDSVTDGPATPNTTDGASQCRMVDSPLGPIPEGWEQTSLGKLVIFKRNSVKKGQLKEPTPYMGLEHFPRKSFALSEWDLTTEIGSSKLSFEKGDVLFGKIRPYFHKVGIAQTDGLCSSDTLVLTARKAEHSNLVAMVAFSESFVAHAVQTSQGTKMPRANWDVLSEYPVTLPPNDLLETFNDLAGPAIEQVRVLSSKNTNLKEQRDLLLPKLISGQIALGHAEQATA